MCRSAAGATGWKCRRAWSRSRYAKDGERSEFHYDEQGRKTKVQTFSPRPPGPLVAHAGQRFHPAFTGAESGAGVPDEGGTVTTIYDDHDQPTEAQVRDAEGHLLSRVVCKYDAKGRTLEEKQVIESFEFNLPAEARAKMLAESGVSQEESGESI